MHGDIYQIWFITWTHFNSYIHLLRSLLLSKHLDVYDVFIAFNVDDSMGDSDRYICRDKFCFAER